MNRRRAAILLVGVVCTAGVRAAPAAAFDPLGAVCGAATLASGILGKACGLVQNGGRLVSAAKSLLGGHVGRALKTALGDAGQAVASHATVAVTLAAIGAWVLGGAKFALRETAKVISETTTPQLTSSWFSGTYWRMAGIASLLTLPFLFAAVIQAVVRSDLALLLRTVLGYLPLALLVVGIAAPVTTLLLAGSDELSALVTSAAGQPGAGALGLGGVLAGLSALAGSPFLLFFLGLLTVAGALTLWLELLIREAAVYVVVLMLPLAFAAMVWPARRAWAVRAVELLVALILSKFAIVAVLSLGGAAMDQAFGHSLTAPLVGLVLVMMGAFAPWVLLRLVPLAEMASAAVGSFRGEARLLARAEVPFALGVGGEVWAARATSDMRRVADEVAPLPSPGSAGQTGGRSAGPGGESDAPGGESDAPGGESDAPGEEPGAPGDATPDPPSEPPGDAPEAPPDPSPEPPAGGPTGGGGMPSGGGMAAKSAGAGPGERIPGLPDMWQAADLTWRPLVLGTEGGWPPKLWPAEPDSDGEVPPGDDLAEERNLLPPPQTPPSDEPAGAPLPGEPATPPPAGEPATPPPAGEPATPPPAGEPATPPPLGGPPEDQTDA